MKEGNDEFSKQLRACTEGEGGVRLAYQLSEGFKATAFRAAVQQAAAYSKLLYRLLAVLVVLGKIRDVNLFVIT